MAKRRRTKRNVKVNNSGFVVPKPFVLVLLAFIGFAMVYLFFCGRCEVLARKIQGLEVQHTELSKRVDNEEYKWWKLTSPEGLEKALRTHHLNMTWPGDRRVVALSLIPLEPGATAVASLAQVGGSIRHE